MAAFSTVAMVGISAASMAMSMAQAQQSASAASSSAAANRRNILANFNAAQAEGTRQQESIFEQAGEQIADRAKMTKQEMATVSQLGAERGWSASTAARYDAVVAGTGGTDQARMLDNAEERVEAIQAQKAKGFLMAQGQMEQVNMAEKQAHAQARSQMISAIGNFAGSAMKIGAKVDVRSRASTRAGNPITGLQRPGFSWP